MLKRRQRKSWILRLLVCLLLIAAACTNGDDATVDEDAISSDEELEITFGAILTHPFYAAYFSAEELGYFEELNLTTDVVTVGADSDCIRGIVAGSIHACPSGVDSLVRAAQAGSDVRAVSNMIQEQRHSLVAVAEIESFEDLRGRSIAAQGQEEGSTVAILGLLAANGIEQDEVDIIEVGGNTDRFAALTGGQVDAAVLVPPAEFEAVDQGFNFLGTSAEGATATSNVVVAVPGRSASEDEALVRLLTGMQRAAEWLVDPANEDAVIQQYETLYEVDEKYAARYYEALLVDLQYLPNGIGMSVEQISSDLELIDQYTSTDVEMSAEELIDTRYIEQVEERLDVQILE